MQLVVVCICHTRDSGPRGPFYSHYLIANPFYSNECLTMYLISTNRWLIDYSMNRSGWTGEVSYIVVQGEGSLAIP